MNLINKNFHLKPDGLRIMVGVENSKEADMIRLVLIRGLPGSGKSTLAKTRFSDFVHLEADMYFTTKDGKHGYSPEFVSDAHKWCITTAKILLRSGQKVVVSNTFSRIWELYPYLEEVNPDEVQITEAQGNWKSLHDISEEKFEIIRERWEPLPFEDWEYIDYEEAEAA